MTVMVTTSLGFRIPISTVTRRVEVLVVELPFVVVTLRISTYDENWSVTVVEVVGAVPVFDTTIV
jgi:hypothetical protein